MWWIESNSANRRPNAHLNMWDIVRTARHNPMLLETYVRQPRSRPESVLSSHEMVSMDATPYVAAVQPTNKGYDPRMLPPTGSLNQKQWLYLTLGQGFFSMILAFILNFVAGWALYGPTRPPPGPPPEGSTPLFLFCLPASVVADAAIGTIVQTLITWFCLVFIVNGTISHGRLQPYAPERGLLSREPDNIYLRWFLFLDHYNEHRGSNVFCCCRSGKPRWIAWVLAGVGRSLIVAVLAYAIMIGPTIGILMAHGMPFEGDWVFLGRWDGVVYKATYGGVLGLWMTPALTWMWMLRAGWIVRRHERLPV